MAKKLEKLNVDAWEVCDLEEINEGDVFRLNGTAYIANSAPSIKEGVPIINAKPYYSDAIVIHLGNERKHIIMAQDYVGSGVTEFSDGTLMIGSLDGGNDAIYSPRLKESLLEAFCEQNMDTYKQFFHEHEAAIEDGQHIPMSRFWESEPMR